MSTPRESLTGTVEPAGADTVLHPKLRSAFRNKFSEENFLPNPDQSPLFSVIIPVFNESESIPELYTSIDAVFTSMKSEYEIIFVNDGSTDDTLDVLRLLAKKSSRITVIDQRRNFGKAIALDTGFQAARGDIIITMDGDLQDDPKEIPPMFEKLNAGFDLVSGWKQKRYDPWHKTVPSKLFNFMTAQLSGVCLHDFNCGFKMYRCEVVKSIRIYGEMHRYIPALAHWKGFRVAEISVKHHPRKYGKSKYGIERLLRGFFDFVTIAFITKYHAKPMHFFGKLGFWLILAGSVSGIYLASLWIIREIFSVTSIGPIGTRPLLFVAVLFIVAGLLFFATGLICEMILYYFKDLTIDSYITKEIYREDSSNTKESRKKKR